MEIQIFEARKSQTEKLKVCAYCRVSTDAEEQENSLDNQIRHYEELIKSNPEYEYAGVYHDFAISGYKEQRPGLQKMLADARAGKINLILTKSVSRFARNTAIVLKATRELREMNVSIYFELQNINTLSGEGELMLSVIAAFAQEESESASMLSRMVYRRKYEQGIPVQYLDRSFGYRKGGNGDFVPDEEQAAWVQKIFQMIADGYSLSAVAEYLNRNKVQTVGGAKWIASTVQRIIQNEIYKGDYIMHKHYVNEERKLVRNRGEEDAWYIEDDHPAIVSDDLWEKAQEARRKKREYLDKGSVIQEFTKESYPYMNHIFCAECGFPLMHRVYSDGNRLNWGCSGMKRFGKKFCKGVNVPDSVLREWKFEGNIYIRCSNPKKAVREYSYVKESSWKRRHKKKGFKNDTPALTEAEYPYLKKLHCSECGSRLVRKIKRHGEVCWECNGRKRKGKEFCSGIRIPDKAVRAFGEIKRDIYIMERNGKNGAKHYSYSCKKPEQDKAGRCRN